VSDTPPNSSDAISILIPGSLLLLHTSSEVLMTVTPLAPAQPLLLRIVRQSWMVLLALVLFPAATFAQAPWERAASNLEATFTGPLARSLALVAIVIGGLMFMFGEGGAKRQISGIVFGGGLALFAAQFLAWLF